MIKITVKVDTERFLNKIKVARDQLPFATALALTRTAQAVKDDLRTGMSSSFKDVTTYTLNSMYVKGATKAELVATVGLKGADSGVGAVNWLSPEIYGGVRNKAIEKLLNKVGLPPDGMYAVPGKSAKMSGGRINFAWLQSLIADMAAQGISSGVITRKSLKRRKGYGSNGTQRYFVLIEKWGKLSPGIYGARGRAAYPLIMFVRQPRYSKRFDFYGIATTTARQRFPQEFAAALRRAGLSRR